MPLQLDKLRKWGVLLYGPRDFKVAPNPNQVDLLLLWDAARDCKSCSLKVTKQLHPACSLKLTKQQHPACSLSYLPHLFPSYSCPALTSTCRPSALP